MMFLSEIRKCSVGIVMGALGIFALVYDQVAFFSAWVFFLLLGLFFSKDKLLNGGIYGVIVVLAIMTIKRSLAFYPLLVIALIFIAVSIYLRRRSP